MGNRAEASGKYVATRYESDLGDGAKDAETLDISLAELAQRGARASATQCARREAEIFRSPGSRDLGAPMNISQVAQLLGCSEWTVRQRYMPQGLPYLRASRVGKLVFFHKQVIDWILQQQHIKKGGIPR